MGKFDGRSRDQKRKAKLKRQEGRSKKHESLAYHGRKYQADEYVGILFSTEAGIHQAYLMSEQTLTDDAVESAIGGLIHRMSEDKAAPLVGSVKKAANPAEPGGLIAWNIVQNWKVFAETRPLPRRDDLIGVLRTILSSVETWRSKSMHARGYLQFLEGFMMKAGVRVEIMDPATLAFSESEDVDDPLLDLGRDWIDGREGAEARFSGEIEGAFEEGEAERIVEVCQELMGETRNPAIVSALERFALRAREEAGP